MGDTEIRGERWEESLLLVSWGAAHQVPRCQHRTGHGPAPDAAAFHEEVWGVVERACCLVWVQTNRASWPSSLNQKPKAGSWDSGGQREKSLVFKRLKKYFRR